MTIASAPARVYCDPVAANSAIRIGVLNPLGGHRLRAVFLCPQHGKAFMGGPCGAASAAPVSSGRYANLHGSAHPDWRQGGGISTRTLEATIMPKRYTLTLNPFKKRAAAHRAMALAALRADSSLATRLKRYNKHMDQARALEAQEVGHA